MWRELGSSLPASLALRYAALVVRSASLDRYDCIVRVHTLINLLAIIINFEILLLEVQLYKKIEFINFSTDAITAKTSKPAASAVAAGRQIGQTHLRTPVSGVVSGKITKTRSASQCACNVSTGRVLKLISMAIGCAGRASAQPKMWEFEVQMRDSGMSCIFAGYSSKKRDG